MKKLYLLAFAACGFLAGQAQETMYLKEVQSTHIPQEIERYWYNEDNQCDSIYFMTDEEYEGTVGIVYDENGNAVTWNLYKLDADYNWLMYNYIIYDYNDEGQVVLSRNYADYFGTGYLVIQGSVAYIYENGLLTKMETYFSTGYEDGGKPYEYSVYTYDDNGLLQKETVYSYSEEEQLTSVTQELAYAYDNQGRVASVTTSIPNDNGTLYENQRDEYQYNEDGDLSTYVQKLQNTGWQPALQTWFKYDTSVNASDVVYPVDPYGQYTVKPNGIHILVYDSTMAEFEGSWGLYDVQEYRYVGWDEAKRPSGIAQAASDDGSEMSAFVLGGRLYVSGLAEGAAVMVYDVNGRLLLAGRYNPAGIPTYVFPAGVKIVKSGNFSAKFF